MSARKEDEWCGGPYCEPGLIPHGYIMCYEEPEAWLAEDREGRVRICHTIERAMVYKGIGYRLTPLYKEAFK